MSRHENKIFHLIKHVGGYCILTNTVPLFKIFLQDGFKQKGYLFFKTFPSETTYTFLRFIYHFCIFILNII